MIRLLWLLALPLLAQTDTYDIFRYVRPQGWKSAMGGDKLVMLRAKEGQICEIALVASAVTAGSPSRDFDEDWDAQVKRPFGVAETPRPSSESAAGGWTILTAATEAERKGWGRSTVSVRVYSGNGLRATVRFSALGNSCQTEFRTFSEHLRLEK